MIFTSTNQRESVKISGEAFLLVFLLLPSVSPAQADIAAARIDASAYQRVVDENLELRKEQARMEGESAELRRRNASLLLDVQDVERKKDQLTVLVSQLKTPAETQSELARLQSEKLVLIREIERLRRAVAASGTPPTNMAPASVSPSAGSDLFRKLEKENGDLRLELAKSREATLNESVAKDLLSRSEASQQILVTQLTGQYKKAITDLENTRRREAALKKALEIQAKKTFEAEARGQRAEDRCQKAEALSREMLDVKRQREAPGGATKAVATESVAIKSGGSDNANSVPVLLSAAEKMLANKRVNEAEKLYLKALKLEPKNARTCYNLGVLYGDYLKNYRKASKYYRRYIQLAPQAPDVAAVRSWVLDMESKSDW